MTGFTVMAPKDWPDCCEICGKEERCKGWMFVPNTRECRIVDTIGRDTRSESNFAVSVGRILGNG